MACLSQEPEREGCVEEVVAVEETRAGGRRHGALDLFLEVVVDAEALEVVDGDQHLPPAAATLTQHPFHVRRQALLRTYICMFHVWRVRTCMHACMHVVMYEEEEEEMDMSLLGWIATWRSKSLRSSVLDDDDAAKVRTKWPRWRTWWWLFAAAAAAGEAAARRRGSTKEEEEEEMTRAGAADMVAPGREYIVYYSN
jgi:hypothetical protein